MRVCVFVDGENLRHTICDLFPDFDRQSYLPKGADWSKFFDDVVEKASSGANRLRTYWYVVQHFDPFPRPLPLSRRNTNELDAWAKTNGKLLAKHHYEVPGAVRNVVGIHATRSPAT